MYKYIQNYAKFFLARPIWDNEDYYRPMQKEVIMEKIAAHSHLHFPEALIEAMQLMGGTFFENAFIKLTNPVDIAIWKDRIERDLNNKATYFIIDAYLDSFASFVFLDGNDNPAVYAYFDEYEDKIATCFLWFNTLEEYLIWEHQRDYAAFQNRLAGRVELRGRVEQAKAIYKTIHNTTKELITPYATEADDRQNFRLALWGLKWSYKTLFYEPYLLRYHSDFSKWEAEMLKFNKSVIDDIKLILPTFEKENPPLALRVAELGRQFVNFEQTIRWVAAAPDATVRKPSPAAQNAAKEERDITDFLL